MTPLPPEDRLLRLAAAGDRQAFDAFVAAMAPAVWRVLCRLTASESVAEDAMQETFLGAWRAAPTWRGEASARSWLFGLARRQAARTWRRRVGEPQTHDTLGELALAAGWGTDPETLAARSQDRAKLLVAVATLSDRDREVIVRCDLEGVAPVELAAELDIDPGTVRVRRHRARLKLLGALRAEVCDG